MARVVDGDTLTLLVDGHQPVTVRLAGIDAPEKGQPFGARAKQNLARLVAGKVAEIRWHKRDRSGRVVGTVWVVSPELPCRDKPDCPKTLDAGTLLDPPPGQAPARLWRQDDWLWWTVPMPGGGRVVVPAGYVGRT